jgi:hypothetical protein
MESNMYNGVVQEDGTRGWKGTSSGLVSYYLRFHIGNLPIMIWAKINIFWGFYWFVVSLPFLVSMNDSLSDNPWHINYLLKKTNVMFEERLHFDNLSLELLTSMNVPLMEYNFLANTLWWILIIKEPHRKYWDENDSQTNVIPLFSLSLFKKYVDTYPSKCPLQVPLQNNTNTQRNRR